MLEIFISSQFNNLHPDAYSDGFRSFTIPFLIGACIYYFKVLKEVKEENNMLQELKLASELIEIES